MATLTKLKFSVKTGLKALSGTDAQIYLVFCGAGAERIYRLPTRPGDLETGKLDIYPVECPDGPDLEAITHVLLVNGMNGPNPAWRVLWCRLEAVDAQGRSWLLLDEMLECWLDISEGRAPLTFLPLSRPLTPLNVDDAVGVPTGRLDRIA
jgi:hypothetical protein